MAANRHPWAIRTHSSDAGSQLRPGGMAAITSLGGARRHSSSTLGVEKREPLFADQVMLISTAAERDPSRHTKPPGQAVLSGGVGWGRVGWGVGTTSLGEARQPPQPDCSCKQRRVSSLLFFTSVNLQLALFIVKQLHSRICRVLGVVVPRALPHLSDRAWSELPFWGRAGIVAPKIGARRLHFYIKLCLSPTSTRRASLLYQHPSN